MYRYLQKAIRNRNISVSDASTETEQNDVEATSASSPGRDVDADDGEEGAHSFRELTREFRSFKEMTTEALKKIDNHLKL